MKTIGLSMALIAGGLVAPSAHADEGSCTPSASSGSCATSSNDAYADVVSGTGQIRLRAKTHSCGSPDAEAHLWDVVTFDGPTATVEVTFRMHARGVLRTDPVTGVSPANAEVRPASARLSMSLEIGGGIDTAQAGDDLGLNVSYLNGGTLYPGFGAEYFSLHTAAPLYDPLLRGYPYTGDFSFEFAELDVSDDQRMSDTHAIDLSPRASTMPSLVVTLPTGVPLPFSFGASLGAQCPIESGPCFAAADFTQGVYAVIDVPRGYTLTSELGATYAGIVDGEDYAGCAAAGSEVDGLVAAVVFALGSRRLKPRRRPTVR